jgi:hypothetical protein
MEESLKESKNLWKNPSRTKESLEESLKNRRILGRIPQESKNL